MLPNSPVRQSGDVSRSHLGGLPPVSELHCRVNTVWESLSVLDS